MLCSLEARNFRILEHLEVTPGEEVTVFCGANGAGKTSILEAIDFLSRGRSFRSRQLEALLRRGSREVTVTGSVRHAGMRKHLGIRKSAGERQLHCDRRPVHSISNHAGILPVVPVHPDSHRLVQAGARYRRNYLDWSSFHVKPAFLSDWRQFSRCLRQRNQLLRKGERGRALQAWTRQIAQAGERIDRTRFEVFDEIRHIFESFVGKLLPEAGISMSYYRGWPGECRSLQEALERAADQERQLRATRWGPHRADFRLALDGRPAARVASRGQQKLLAASLLLAQIRHLRDHAQRPCIVLLDDLCAELDRPHAQTLMQAVQSLGCQTFISTVEPERLDLQGWRQAEMFHVKQGTCTRLRGQAA